MSFTPIETPTAHGVRLPAFDPTASTGSSAPADDDVAGQIIAALRTGPLIGFDVAPVAYVEGVFVEGRVIVRFDGKVRSLACMDASVLAIVVRLEPGLRGADLFADAFCLAAVQAGNKVDALHAWSRGVRPTEAPSPQGGE